MNSYFLCVCLCSDLRCFFFFQKNKNGKDLRYKGLPNEEICWEIFASNTTTGHIVYGSGSTAPPCSEGNVREDTNGPLYEDISIGEHTKDDHVSPSPPPPTSGVLPINRRSRSIEKRWGKQKQVFKSDMVLQIWQKAYNESKHTGSMSTATTPDLLETCQDILEAMELPNEIYTPALQLFIDKPSYQKSFMWMKPERRFPFLQGIIGTTPYVPQPPPPSEFQI